MFRDVWFEYLARESKYWWLHPIRGFAAIAFAMIAILWARVALLVLVALVAAWAFIIGVLELFDAFRLRAVRKRLRGF
jgi:uncharacterized membrane protein HdeD (DUF308 family)